MQRFSAKFGRTLVVSLATAGALSACGGEESVIPDAELAQQAVGKAEQELATHLDRAAQALGVGRAEFVRKSAQVDELGYEHTRFQQTVRGVPVEGGEAIVHHDARGGLQAITDTFRQGLKVDTVAKLNESEAVAKAVNAYGGYDLLTAAPESKLLVKRMDDGTDRLVYKVQLRREDGSLHTDMPVYYVDAQSGDVVGQFSNLQTATGTGASLYSGSRSLTTFLSGTTYYLEDTGRKMGTFDMRNGTSSGYRYTDTDNAWGNGSTSSTQSAAVDAHFGAQMTYDYYFNTHARKGVDGNGGPGGYTSIDGVTRLLSSRVHYSTKYNNAFWNGTYMTYGDGDGTTFTPLVTLDICGHEMTHGVTERTAGLVYSNESGALNESMSDVFGAMVERYALGESANTWKIGEGAYTPATAGDALRYMDNPHAKAGGTYTPDDDPDHYAERYTGTADNGGVHINSGIGNKAFYLLAKGGTHHRSGVTVTGIGADAAAKIWYKALTTYMTSSTNFAGARAATLNAAAALYGSGSANYNAVASAWTAVGVN
jgi:thermolysin